MSHWAEMLSHLKIGQESVIQKRHQQLAKKVWSKNVTNSSPRKCDPKTSPTASQESVIQKRHQQLAKKVWSKNVTNSLPRKCDPKTSPTRGTERPFRCLDGLDVPLKKQNWFSPQLNIFVVGPGTGPLFSLGIFCIYMYEDQKCKKYKFSGIFLAFSLFSRKRTFKTGKWLANFKIDV